MKTLAKTCQAALLAAIVAAPAFAGSERTGATGLDAAFGGSAPALETLDTRAMEETRGRFPLLVVPLSIAGVDLGLAAFFWSVYVPQYTGAGACSGCTTVIQRH